MNGFIETLEKRELLSAAGPGHQKFRTLVPVNLNAALSTADVTNILGRAASQALPTQAVAITDREGELLGLYVGRALAALPPDEEMDIIDRAVARARTVSFFESSGEAFSTRTARFIIQDHFPWPIRNTPGGPLYGVEFSSLLNSDILIPSQTPAITGDPGGIPLYLPSPDPGGKAVPSGGIGVAGDFHDVGVRPDITNFLQSTYALDSNPKHLFYNGVEEHDYDEAVAMAGAAGLMAPEYLRANHIFVAGLRFPFTVDGPAHKNSDQPLSALLASGAGSLMPVDGTVMIRPGQPEMDTPNFTVAGDAGLLRQWSNHDPATGALRTNPQSSDPIRGATDAAAVGAANALTAADVLQIIENAVRQATNTRAGIRKPNGINAEVHVVVVDTNGNVLGAFRMHDGTNFSYDVAVQKARTATFFSDNNHAFSARAIGFMSQDFFPPGIPHERGPLYHLQDMLDEVTPTGHNNDFVVTDSPGTPALVKLLSLRPSLANTPLRNGITIFPGGFPLYRNGVLIGGIGISGDGVDQDDIIGYAGTLGFRPRDGIRSDQLSGPDAGNFILSRVEHLLSLAPDIPFDTSQILPTLSGKHLRLPYTKFPRNPEH